MLATMWKWRFKDFGKKKTIILLCALRLNGKKVASREYSRCYCLRGRFIWNAGFAQDLAKWCTYSTFYAMFVAFLTFFGRLLAAYAAASSCFFFVLNLDEKRRCMIQILISLSFHVPALLHCACLLPLSLTHTHTLACPASLAVIFVCYWLLINNSFGEF